MKAKPSLATATCPKTMARRLRTGCAAKLALVLLFLALPALVQAQYNYTTNNNTITITGYTGSGGAVAIPSTINGLPVASIGDGAFFYCASLISVAIGNSVTSIGDYAFYSCTDLTNVTIGNSVTSIGDQAFSGCSSLTGVYFQGDAPSVASSAFSGANNATVYYLAGTTGWGPTFAGRPTMLWNPEERNYTYTVINGMVTITKYTGSGGAVIIPSTINGLPVTSIGTNVFISCNSLASVTIPNSVTSIGYAAFAYCTSLTNVTIGNSVTSIGGSAFWGCTSLTNVTIGNSVTSIGGNAFWGCTSLTSVTIPNSVTNIGFLAFYYCTNLTSVTIPNGVTSIGDSAFSGCTSLTIATIGKGVTSMDGAFSDCTSLAVITVDPLNSVYSSVDGVLFNKSQTTLLEYPLGKTGSYTIPNSVTSIEDWAFYYCTRLTSVTIPNSVTSIGDEAFYYCTSLTSATIPNSVTSIGDEAFYGCTSLAAITVDALNPVYSSIAGVLFNKSLTMLIQYPRSTPGSDYKIPNSVTSIGDSAFYSCTGLTSVTIPSGVTNIGDSPFYSCTNLAAITVDTLNPVYSSMAGILFNKDQTTLIQYSRGTAGSDYTVPNSVTNIGYGAFNSCTSLISVTIPDSVTSIGVSAFWGCTSLTGVYCQGNAPSVYSGFTDAPCAVGPFLFSDANNATVYYLAGTTGWDTATFEGRPTMLWNPQVQTSDASFGVRTNRFGFTIAGASGMVIVVEACTNLTNPTWFPLQTNTLSGDSFYFSDPQWTNYSARFYRLRSP